MWVYDLDVVPVNSILSSLKGKYVWKYFTSKKRNVWRQYLGCQYYGENKFSLKESSFLHFHLVHQAMGKLIRTSKIQKNCDV